MSETRVCLDLFSGLGGFSQAFVESPEWDVVTVDVCENFDPDISADVLGLRPADLPDADVVLAGHPCTVFSTAGNWDEWDHDRQEPVGDRSKRHVALVYHTLGLIQALSPDFWYLENPRRSRIRWFIGQPDDWVSYCQYGRDYQKDTGLWGNHAPMVFKKCPGNGASCHGSNGESDGYTNIQSMPSDTGERAKVPYQLSLEIREAVEAAYANPPPEQSTLTALADGGESA